MGHKRLTIAGSFSDDGQVVLHSGDCRGLLKQIPDSVVQLVVTSPPYNIGKVYERRLSLDMYVAQQSEVIAECVRVLRPSGSLCWQTGNYVDGGEIVPLDALLYPVFVSLGLKMRNRIVWHFEHGLHCSRRFSGRYEVISWFTKTESFYFNVDPVRVPQKYPNKKHFKGPKAGQFSGDPRGKNPGDVWVIPNVKSNHVEKTIHPCQFPVELVQRLVLSMSEPGDWVLDPFMGVGSSAVAAVLEGRRTIGAELVPEYLDVARDRIRKAWRREIRVRPMDRPVYDPSLPNGGQSRQTNFPVKTDDMPLFRRTGTIS